MYEELKDKNFELVAVAEDTAGEAAAGPFYDAADATFTQLVDTRHLVSSLYGLLNVPTAILIDEEGRIVRSDEGAYTRTYKAGTLEFGTDTYLPALRDWVEKGKDSTYAQAGEAVAAKLRRRSSAQARADAHFRLGTHFFESNDVERAERHWHAAQELDPDSWNYHRQEWSFTPSEHGRKWLEKFRQLGDRPYYAPMDLPTPASDPNEH